MDSTLSDIKQKITKWFEEEGFEITEEDNLMNNEIVNDFTLRITKGGSYSVHIAKPKGGSRIVIGRAVTVPELDQKAYSRLNEDIRRKFSNDSMLGLIHMKVVTAFDPPRPEINIKTIRLMNPIYYDGLSKDRMFKRMNKVMFAYAFVMLKFSEFNISSTRFDPSQQI